MGARAARLVGRSAARPDGGRSGCPAGGPKGPSCSTTTTCATCWSPWRRSVWTAWPWRRWPAARWSKPSATTATNRWLDSALSALARYLDEHGKELHDRLGSRSPWWLPGPIEGRGGQPPAGGARNTWLGDMSRDRNHPLRRHLDTAMVTLAADLQTSVELRSRGEELKAELLGQPQLRRFAATLWEDTKVRLRTEATDPSSRLQHAPLLGHRAHRGQAARRNRSWPRARSGGWRRWPAPSSAASKASWPGWSSGTIARWDGRETSRRLELLLGPDLQYIRINGTVVGGLAGLILHGLSQAL